MPALVGAVVVVVVGNNDLEIASGDRSWPLTEGRVIQKTTFFGAGNGAPFPAKEEDEEDDKDAAEEEEEEDEDDDDEDEDENEDV